MSVAAARRLVFGVLAMYVVMLTWPGVVPFNRIEPRVLGLPFIMIWISAWVVLTGVALALLHAAETRAEARAELRATGSVPPADRER
jgi:hypothetical protein